MRSLTVKLPHAVWLALEEQQRATGDSIHHIVRSALAEYLDLDHQTLFQVSTSTALVEGIYRGAVTVAHLKEHGDLGLGTFEGVDGELVMVDGRVYQVRADGTCREVDDATASPFAVVVHFHPEQTVELGACADVAALAAQLDRLRASANVFYAIRLEGAFASLHTRSMCRTEEGVPLVVAAAHQPEFQLRDVRATLVGFWSPDYAKTVNVPGYHLHAVTADRRTGGHVLDCAGTGWRVAIQPLADLRVALPATEEFLRADLSRDASADLATVEHGKR